MHYGVEPNLIDHINGDRKDNRIANLREVARSENAMNSARKSNNTSGVTGVWLCSKTGKWNASIACFGDRRWLGRFDTLQEAAEVRAKAERELGFTERHGKPLTT